MLAADTSIELGQMCGPDAATSGPRHQLLYLPVLAMVVMPYATTRDGWECVIAASRVRRTAHHLALSHEQLAAGSRTIPAQPERDPDGYAHLVWMSQAFRHWPGGAMLALARHIVEDLRHAGSLRIPAAALADYTSIATRLPTTRPVAVGRLLDQLITAALLTRDADGAWRLTLPPVQHARRPTEAGDQPLRTPAAGPGKAGTL